MPTQRVIDRDAFFERIGYKPLPKQRLFHQSGARFRIPVCGRRFGKSTMAGRDLEPKLFIPNKRYWIVGPTYDLGEKEFRVIWDDLIVGQKLGQDKRVKKAYNKRSGEMYISFPWNTHLEVRSADHPEFLIGEALHGVIMSEAAKHRPDTWERFIRASLSDFRGFADFPTTPEGFNWLYDLWQLGQNPAFPDYEAWRFPSWENSFLFPGGREDPEILLQERTTTREWFMQEYAADFASFVGKIYSEWDETAHVRQIKFNPAWASYVAFDWGYTNPLAAVFFQVDPWDNVYIWREHYLSYTRLEQHIDIIKRMDNPPGYHLDLAFGDAADPEAAATVSAWLVPCMADPMAKSNWRQGIDLVKTFLRLTETGKTDEYGAPMYAPRLFVDYSCVNTIKEFNNYRATDNQNVNRREAAATGPTNNKIDDHTLDAIRYGLMHLFELGAKHHLSEVVGGVGVPQAAARNEEFSMVLSPTTSDGGGGFFTMDTEF
jgi:hypothetical protein